MGMFDTIYIYKKFLPSIKQVEDNGYSLSSLQTKDFENLLETYHVDENGKLTLDKVEYVFIENDKPKVKGKWNPPFFQEEKSRERIFIPHTGIITAGAFFMDYNNPKDEIFVDIDFKFIDGILQSVGTIKTMTITPVEQVLERRRQIEESRNKRDKDNLYQLYRFISKVISRVTARLNRIQTWLNSYEPK